MRKTFQSERLRFGPYSSVCGIGFIQHRCIQHVTHPQNIQIAFEITFSVHKGWERECMCMCIDTYPLFLLEIPTFLIFLNFYFMLDYS